MGDCFGSSSSLPTSLLPEEAVATSAVEGRRRTSEQHRSIQVVNPILFPFLYANQEEVWEESTLEQSGRLHPPLSSPDNRQVSLCPSMDYS